MDSCDRLGSICRIVSSLKAELTALSDAIWAHPETAFQEKYACAALSRFLAEKGFSVEPAAGLPTAFVASRGAGSPVIGFLGEYDALPGLYQPAGVSETDAKPGGAGHGCGHNLLGVGAAGAAAALSEYLEKNRLPGTVRFYGCPAEESGAGKEILARSGVFDGLDACFTWHPETRNCVVTQSTLANIIAEVEFHGKTSHAAASPELGRSALDACELMNVGANYLREHVSPDVRFHYAYTDAGGSSPNIVQSKASLLYYIRAERQRTAEDVFSRLADVAKGAALMTGTEVSFRRGSTMSDYLPNDTLGRLADEAFRQLGAPVFSPDEIASAACFSTEVPPFSAEIEPYRLRTGALSVSTDVGNVSHIVPTAQIYVSCFAKGTPFHDRRMTAQAALPAAHRGMMTAAAVLAAAAAAAAESPVVLTAALTELHETK